MDSINSYVYRGQRPEPLGTPTKRIQTAAGERLSTIVEDGSSGAGGSNRNSGLTHLPWNRSQHHGDPPLATEEKRPPSYATNGGSRIGEAGSPEKVSNGFIARIKRRGGLKRLALIILAAALLLIIALGAGLGVGLSHKSSSTSSQTTASGNGSFPTGAYVFEPFLTNVRTSCTSNSSTWSCFPYTTYSSSPSGSEATFDWIITESPHSPNQFLISSTDNPLAVMFANATLTLLDANTDQERYTFSVPNVVKTVVPPVSLSNDNTRSTCFYNSTVLRASLYTRMTPTLTDSSGSSPQPAKMAPVGSMSFNQTWPGAVMIEQVAQGGSDVPNCFRLENGRAVGSQIPLATESSGTACSCVYMNYS